MTRLKIIIGLLFFLATAAPAAAQEPAAQRFENATAGISLLRPAGWQTATLQSLAENRERIRLPDKELQEAIQKHASAPLFVFTKHPEPHSDLNPTIQVTLRPAGAAANVPPTETLRAVAGSLQKAFADFAWVEPVHATEVSGLKAAAMKATYTLANAEGQSFKVLARMWIVPRGAFLFIVGMSGPQAGADVSEDEFAAVQASIQIER